MTSLPPHAPVPRAVASLPGQGVQGQVGDRLVTIGSHTLLHSEAACLADFCQLVTAAEANGQTTMLVREDEALRGYLAVSDPPRQASRDTITALKEIVAAWRNDSEWRRVRPPLVPLSREKAEELLAKPAVLARLAQPA